MKPADGVTRAVYTEQVRAVFRQMPIALAVNFINAVLTTIVLAPLAAQPIPLPFFVAVTFVTVGRVILWLRYRVVSVQPETAHLGSRVATGGALLTGLCWGIGGALLFPVIPVVGKIFLIIVIGGMCAGAAVVNASHLPTLLAFLLSASLPIAAGLLIEGSTANDVLGGLIVVFTVALALAGRHLNHTFAEGIELRVELNDANLHLRAEIDERRATEEALRQAQKLEAVGHLTGGIAHDFNNLMTVVIGNLLLASARVDKTSAEAPLLQGALQAAQRGAALIERLLAFARKQRLDPRSLDLRGLVTGLEELLRRTLGPEIRLLISADPMLASAHVDANQVELAILNLTINARDAMPEGGTMCIAIESRHADGQSPPELTSGDYIVLAISDDGTGMDEATLAQVFEPFFTTKEIGSGSGLGLSMVQGFASQSGGTVRIRSKPGEGTTVELWLPQADEPPSKPVVVDRSGLEIGRGVASVLLCDDDDGVRDLLSTILKSGGYTVREASGAEAALRILESKAEIDLLIVDYAMPGMNGIEVIRQARLRQPGLLSLLITGYAGVPTSAGVPVLRKPFTPDELARTVTDILATS
jgi:signal transduction histidine kinase/CheY-like chemotaxis protein